MNGGGARFIDTARIYGGGPGRAGCFGGRVELRSRRFFFRSSRQGSLVSGRCR
jgi:hypothetical protein